MLCATVTPIGRATVLEGRSGPRGLMAPHHCDTGARLLLVSNTKPTQGLTPFVKSQHWGQLPVSSVGMQGHHQSSALTKDSRCPG